MKCPQCLRRKGGWFPYIRGHLAQVKGVLNEEGLACGCRERSAGPAARLCGFSQQYGGEPMAASPTATATATASLTATATATPTATATASPTATATALPRTGGPPLVGPVTLVATLTLLASGVGALVLLRRAAS
jgi:carbohydrate-binding DOMON domain-containing protein